MTTAFIHQLGGIFRERFQDRLDSLLPTAACMVMNFRIHTLALPFCQESFLSLANMLRLVIFKPSFFSYNPSLSAS